MSKKQIPPSRRRELVAFGRRLKTWRKSKGWSQEKLALASGLDYSYVNEIENGKLNPGLLTILTLAKALEITPANLFASPDTLTQPSSPPSEPPFPDILKQPHFIDVHCQLIGYYLENRCFDAAQSCLTSMNHYHMNHWRITYLLARYYCLRALTHLGLPQFAMAESSQIYQVAKPTGHVQRAFETLKQALQNPDPANISREWAATDPDFKRLAEHFPDEYRHAAL